MYFRVGILRLSSSKNILSGVVPFTGGKKKVFQQGHCAHLLDGWINFDALGSKERQFRWILQKNMTCLSLMRVGVV